MKPPPLDIPGALRRLREDRRLSQDDVAARMVPKRQGSGVHKIETGNPTVRMVAVYLRAIGADLAELARVEAELTGRSPAGPRPQSPDLALAYLEAELEYWMSKSPEGRARLETLRQPAKR